MKKNKAPKVSPYRLHPELRQQGLLYRAGYGGILGLEWDEQGLWVISRSGISLWDLEEPTLKRCLWTPIQAYSRDQQGRWFSASLHIDCWDSELGHLHSFDPHRGGVLDMSCSPDGQFLVSLGRDQQLLVSDSQGQILRQMTVGEASRLALDWTVKHCWVAGERIDLASGLRLAPTPIEREQVWKHWRLDQEGQVWLGEEPLSLLHEPAQALVADPSGTRLALASERELVILSSQDGEVLQALDDYGEWPLVMALTPDQRHLLLGGMDGHLSVRQLSSGRLTQQQEAHQDAVTALAAGPEVVVSGAADGTLACWSWPGLEALGLLDGHDGPVQQLLLDQRRLFSAGLDGQILIWDWPSQSQLTSLTGYDAGVEQLKLAHNGEILLAIYDDGSLCSWDISRFGQG